MQLSALLFAFLAGLVAATAPYERCARSLAQRDAEERSEMAGLREHVRLLTNRLTAVRIQLMDAEDDRWLMSSSIACITVDDAGILRLDTAPRCADAFAPSTRVDRAAEPVAHTEPAPIEPVHHSYFN